MQELQITPENFRQYFRDARIYKPEKDDILAKFTAVAEFVEGQGKKDIIHLLKTNKAREAVQVMSRIHGVKPPWCYRVPRLMAADMLIKSEAEVEATAYEMVVEFLFWTKKDYIPKNDIRWTTIDAIEYDQNSGEYKSKIKI